MSWFGKLFGSQAVKATEPLSLAEAQAHALLSFLIPQLQMLELELAGVPDIGTYVSKRSRGYIYGMAAGILGALDTIDSAAKVEDIMQAAFTLVYGHEAAQTVYELTLAECEARDGETLAGCYRAEDDVGDVYAGKPMSAVMGFWLLNSGMNDANEIMPTINEPRPLPSIPSA